jgi:hypothetical protein
MQVTNKIQNQKRDLDFDLLAFFKDSCLAD